MVVLLNMTSVYAPFSTGRLFSLMLPSPSTPHCCCHVLLSLSMFDVYAWPFFRSLGVWLEPGNTPLESCVAIGAIISKTPRMHGMHDVYGGFRDGRLGLCVLLLLLLLLLKRR
jgi:hypothetical protein